MIKARSSSKHNQSLSGVNELLDQCLDLNQLKNDAALCRFLDVPPPVVSKMRHGRIGMSGDIKILLHEKFGLPISTIQRAVNAV